MGTILHRLLNFSAAHNSSSNVSWHGCESAIDLSPFEIASISVQISLWILVILGNLLVLLTLMLHKSAALSKSPTNQLLLSLSMADLLLGLLVLPAVIHKEILSDVWIWGDILCDIYYSTDVILFHCSIYNLIAISIDRYKAVTDPLNYSMFGARKMVPRLIVGAWVSALLAALPHMVVRTIGIINHQLPECSCSITDDHDFTHFLTIFQSIFFFGPLFLLIWLNVIILLRGSAAGKLQTIRVHRGGSVTPIKAPQLSVEPQRAAPIMHSNSFSERLRLAARKLSQIKRQGRTNEQKLGTTVLIVIVSFCVCCVPFFTLAVVDLATGCTVEDGCLSTQMYELSMWLGYANSALNPLIYGACSANFRNAVVRTMKIMCCWGCFKGKEEEASVR